MSQKTPEKTSRLSEDTQSVKVSELERKLTSLKEEVKSNPAKKAEKEEEIRRTREELMILKQVMNKTKQFTKITSHELAKWANELEDIAWEKLMRIDKESWLRRWEFLSNTFLYKRTTDADGNIYEDPSDGKSLKEGDLIYVDLWRNKNKNSAYWKIWLGHMLSADIRYVKVDGKIWIRSAIDGREGYYFKPERSWYLPVFTGSVVTVPTASEISVFEKTKDTKLVPTPDQKTSDERNDAYISYLENTPRETLETDSIVQESYDFWISKWLTRHQTGGALANEKEESWFNAKAFNQKEIATGIFQWRWERQINIANRFGKPIHEMTHKEQLEAAYWEMTEWSYKHVFSQIKWASTASESAKIFATHYEQCDPISIPKRMQNAEMYTNLFDPELSNTAKTLGDYLVRKGPARTGENMCWAAVHSILTSFGIRWLPGANGEDWDSLMNERPNQFKKVRINHPSEALPWGILVYQDSERWSAANKEHWHVEIKWSNGKYYFYLANDNPGWSGGKSWTKGPDQFKKESGFIWYAYYPIIRI